LEAGKPIDALYRLFERSSGATFGVDLQGRIRFWNRGCERLFGYSRKDVCGMACCEIFCGTDLQGNPFCGLHCPIPKVIDGTPPSGNFDLIVKRASGGTAVVNIGAYYTPPAMHRHLEDVVVFLSMRPSHAQRSLQGMATAPGEAISSQAGSGYGLTPREVEILKLASHGLSTAIIAERLAISAKTLRNHMQNIYPKLGVHGRAEAVAFALRRRLV